MRLHRCGREPQARSRRGTAPQRNPAARRRSGPCRGTPRPPYRQFYIRAGAGRAGGRLLAGFRNRAGLGIEALPPALPSLREDGQGPGGRRDAAAAEGLQLRYHRRGLPAHHLLQDWLPVRAGLLYGGERRGLSAGIPGTGFGIRHGHRIRIPDQGRHPRLCGKGSREARGHRHQGEEDNPAADRRHEEFRGGG